MKLRSLSFLVLCGLGAICILPGAPAFARDDLGRQPHFIVGEIIHNSYDGVNDDLLTGGVGKTDLQSPIAPAFADAAHPTAAELRRRAIYNNYRALVDMTTKGGYGVLYGPNIDLNGNDTLGNGKIAGDEYLAYADKGDGHKNVTMMVQIPASFDPHNACIVTATSSGSRGVYGAIGTAGEWGLKRGCAVAYTDKGTGNGAHDLQADTVNLIDGVRQDAVSAGTLSNFTADLTPAGLAAFNAQTPNRFAFKHAHSRQNPEKDWGKDTLQAVKFAFFVLNEKFATPARPLPVRRSNTIVIASSASNGAGAAIAAAELDEEGLIDGVAVSEPQIQPKFVKKLAIQRGSNPPFTGHSKPLLDFFTLANLFQPCASLSAGVSASPWLFLLNATRAVNRCTSLEFAGLLAGDTTAAQADSALAILRESGWEPESDLLHASHYVTSATPGVTLTYANAYGRFSVAENLCGFSFGATNPAPTAILASSLARIFADGNGVPPTGGVNIINNNSIGGPLLDVLSVSPSTGQADFNVDGALCLRSLFTGIDPATGMELTGKAHKNAGKVQEGIENVLRDGDLHGKPAIIVHGRSDALIPVNFSSRPYFGLNQLAEGHRSRLRYYEVTNAQHFDTFIGIVAGYDKRFVPLHVYLIQGLNLMFDHLKNGRPLPPSQVVRTVPRGEILGFAPPITSANVPSIQANPPSGDLITFRHFTVHVPD